MKIANKIQKLRKKENMSQEDLANKVSVTRQTISNWENGESSPDLKQAKELAKIFNVSLDELSNNEIKISKEVKKTSNIEKLAGMAIKFFLIVSFLILVAIASIIFFSNYYAATPQQSFMVGICKVNNELKHYKINFDKNGEIYSVQTNIEYIESNPEYQQELQKYYEQTEVVSYIEKIVKEHGDTCGDAVPQAEVEEYIKNLG